MVDSKCCEPGGLTAQQAIALDVFDSRALGRTSCFAQRFMRPGAYRYNVVPGHGQSLATDHPFMIRVGEEKADEMAQHNILVSDEGSGFTVDQPDVSIRVGDLVLWSGQGRTRKAFAVAGAQEFFNSHRMVNECGYSHAFGLPGEYHWTDAFGSGLSGTVKVRSPDAGDRKAFARWQKQLGEGKLVMISDGRVDHPKIDIVVGQTIFFSVVTSGGISITDERLLKIGNGTRKEPAKTAS
jgi:plastocyanin